MDIFYSMAVHGCERKQMQLPSASWLLGNLTAQHVVCCACHTPLSYFAVLCPLCFLPPYMHAMHATYTCQMCACTGWREGNLVSVSGSISLFACGHAHVVVCVCVIQACWLQQCKRLERKRARQASGSLSDTDKAAPTAGEPGYLSKLRRSISSLRSSRRYFDSV